MSTFKDVEYNIFVEKDAVMSILRDGIETVRQSFDENEEMLLILNLIKEKVDVLPIKCSISPKKDEKGA